jgi:hypothetical protein
MYECDCRQLFGLVIGFIGHLHIVTTNNYNAVANSTTCLLTTVHTKSSQFVFTGCFLLMDPNCPLLMSLLASECLSLSLSHIATDGQSVCLSWYRAPSGVHDQILVTF